MRIATMANVDNPIPLGSAPNREGEHRVEPSPPDKQPAITKAFQHFGLL